MVSACLPNRASTHWMVFWICVTQRWLPSHRVTQFWMCHSLAEGRLPCGGERAWCKSRLWPGTKSRLLLWDGCRWAVMGTSIHCKGLRPKPWIGALSKAFYVGTDKSPDAWQMYTRDWKKMLALSRGELSWKGDFWDEV